MNANAYAFGQHVVFGAGYYQPRTGWGLRLLAHELTHVVQQGGGGAWTEAESPHTEAEAALASPCLAHPPGAIKVNRSARRGMARQRGQTSADPKQSVEEEILSDLATATLASKVADSIAPEHPVWKKLDPLWMVGILRILETASQRGYLSVVDKGVDRAAGVFRERLRLAVDAVKLKGNTPGLSSVDERFIKRLQILPQQQQTEILSYVTGGAKAFLVTPTPLPGEKPRPAGPTIEEWTRPPIRPPATSPFVGRSVAELSATEKLTRCIELTASSNKVSDETRKRLKELLTPESIAMMVGFTTLYVASQVTPAGWAADILAGGLFLVTVFMIGTEVVEVVRHLAEFGSGAVDAKNEKELEAAADHLAFAISKVTVDVIVAILMHKAGKAAEPYIKPPNAEGIAVDMVTPDGRTARVTMDAIPEKPGTQLESRGAGAKGGGEPPPSSRAITRPAVSRPPRVQRVSTDMPTTDYLPYEVPDAGSVTDGAHLHLIDGMNRPLKAEGWLSSEGAGRTSAQGELTGPGSAYHGTQASHLLPAARGGSGQWFNLVPLEAAVNKGQMASVEAFLATKVKGGSSIYAQVYVKYMGKNRIPTELTYYIYELANGKLSLIEKRMVGGEAPVFVH